MKLRDDPRLVHSALALALGFLVPLAACRLASGHLDSPLGWVATGTTAAAMLRWGALPALCAALGAALAVRVGADLPVVIALSGATTVLVGAATLRRLLRALGFQPGFAHCGDVARFFFAVSLATTVPAALTVLAYSVTDPTLTPNLAALRGLKWSFQGAIASFALVPPLLALDADTLRRWRSQGSELLGLLLLAGAIAALALLRLPQLTWVILLGLPLVAVAAIRTDLAFAGLLALLLTLAAVLSVQWAAVGAQHELAARLSGRVWAYCVLLSGLMLTVHALRAERSAIELQIQATRARYRLGMLSTAVREQERIGRQLQQDLGLELAQLASALEALDASARRLAPQQLDAEVATMRAACARAVQATEAVAHGLMPPIDRDGDLGRALRELAARIQPAAGIAIRFDCGARVRLPVDASRDVYRIVQEALNNVLKHSQAGQVWIRLTADAAGGVELMVEDDGVGPAGGAARTTDAPAAPGIGLRTMRYRAERAGGALRIEPRPEGGTRVVALIPPPVANAPDKCALIEAEPRWHDVAAQRG